ncbi:baculoviral IAP repeat-containing protein 2 isoform X3 [Zootoca vivipara]|uniref:baculoviral IAP repeat-containing protein 2 isoform X3 n=1 Tax=Zootoca vivipara TaxID=8524 RepID=UPI00159026DB|nr:baculoviral IAP repeat-containing protein 2 isoform X3 [Zootoca vivipara]
MQCFAFRFLFYYGLEVNQICTKLSPRLQTRPILLSYFIVMNIYDSFPSKLRNSSDVSELTYDLSCELYRMSTFSTFPRNVPVSERSLARAGFYYTGVKDKVKCFSCGLMLDNWKNGDKALDKHKQLYPSCNFVKSLTPLNNLGSSFNSAFSPPTAFGLSSSHSPTPAANMDQIGYISGSFSSFPPDPVTSRAVEDLSHLRPKTVNYAMSTEEVRLHTFESWPLTFLSPSSLAKAGFYYIGPVDRVACFACGGQLSNWEPKDNAMSEHRRHFPNCPFVEQMRDQTSFTVSNMSMQTYVMRLSTFKSWPAAVPVQPPRLADAGFYYVGRNDDVKCFCCDGGLRCWESGDDPWVEHAKWFPRCEYLRHMKGQEFVHQIQVRFPHLLEQLLSTSDTPVDENVDPRDEMNEEEKVVQAEEVTSDLSLIRKNRNALFQRLTCVLPILESLLTSKVITEVEYHVIKQKTQTPLQARELIDTILVKGNTAANIFRNGLQECDSVLYKDLFEEKKMPYIQTEDVSGLPMEEQLRRLQEERTCKVCMDKEVSIVFIPCGHLVVCKECAPSLRKCPICRGTIKGTVRTFLS